MRRNDIRSDPAEVVWTVSELTRRIKRILEADWSGVWVEGELSNARLHSSGHLYFTVKDERAALRGVMFRGDLARLKFRPADGLAVRIFGGLTIYEPQGNWQIVATRMEPSGVGALELAFRQTFERLEREGLFDPAHKVPLPAYPRVVGVVTSPTGAAIRDVLSVLERRAPHVRVVVRPARVQGEGAALELARGVEELDRWGGCDVILLTRGGGSLEDLMAFNDEGLARAIHACRTPVVSAVGHEVDRTIADWAADLRAPTPSVGAEQCAPERRELAAATGRLATAAAAGIGALLRRRRERVMLLAGSSAFRGPLAYVRRRAQDIDRAREGLDRAWTRTVDQRRLVLRSAEGRLGALSPLAVLERGYAIVRTAEGRVVRRPEDVGVGESIDIRLAALALAARVEEVRAEESEETDSHGP